MELNAKILLENAVRSGASDIFIVAGLPASIRLNGTVVRLNEERLLPGHTGSILSEIYELADHRSMDTLDGTGDDDFSFAIPGLSRFRVSAYKQRSTLSAVIRIITFTLPDPAQLGIPEKIINFSTFPKGMVLFTGSAGSGKSTSLACIIDYINQHYEKHIITLEDPLEFLHRHNRSIVSQREINVDTQSYVTALRAALRQSPDVILLGEMRDYETIQVAMTGAETGQLIFPTRHTVGAANTIDRTIDVSPPNQQHQIAVQLSMVLQAVVSQQLVPSIQGTMVPAFEIMTVTPAVRSMIRDNKIPQLEGTLYSSANADMVSMDTSLLNLYKSRQITGETALNFATNPDMLRKRL